MAVSSNAPQKPVVSEDNVSSVKLSPAVVYFDVRRGATRAPRRPFPVGRFLFGSGAQCDVKLGGENMPLLHSILKADGRDVLIEAVAKNPPLTVNGIAVDSVHLHSGDVVAIGAFEFVVECAKTVEVPKAAHVDSERLTSVKPTADADDANYDELDEVSAAALLEMLEAEMDQMENFESRRMLGAGALLQAALELASVDELQNDKASIDIPAQPSLRIAASGADETQESNPDLDEIVARLDGFSSQLESRSQRLAEREAKYLEAAAELLKSQQRLAANLDLLQKQVESLATTPPKALRASA